MATATLTPYLEQERAAHATSSRAEHTGRRYVLTFIAVLAAVYLFPLAAERIPALQPWSASHYSLRLDYNYTLDHTDADVVIFGDSSALYDIDTVRLARETGFKVVNLPQTIPNLYVNGDVPLRRYLGTNKQPRLILFAFMPWSRDYKSFNNGKDYEGIEQAIRHDTPAEFFAAFRRSPWRTLTFPFAFYLVPSRITDYASYFKPTPKTLFHDGFEPYIKPEIKPLKADCALPARLQQPAANQSLQQLQNQVGNDRTRFLTVYSPVPACSGAAALRGIYGNAIATLPAQYFANDTNYAHILGPYSGISTDRVAAQIKAALAQ